MKFFNIVFNTIFLVLSLSFSIAASADGEWFDGGTLNDKTSTEWKAATEENKLASSANVVASLWLNDRLTREIKRDIDSVGMDGLRPYAVDLSTCIDVAITDVSFQIDVSDLAVLCVSLMEWIDT